MGKICRIVFYAFGALYILALGLFVIGIFGLFGAEQDPMSAVFLIPLGWPWNRAIDFFPESSWPWLLALAPTLTLIAIRLLCRLLHGERLT